MLKRMPHIHKNIIHVGSTKLHGPMLSMAFNFFYAVISFQIDVGLIIIWLVVGGVAGLEDKWGDIVVSEKMWGLIIKVDFMDVKEEDLLIEYDSSTGPTKDTHFLHTAIPVHIYRRLVVD